MSDTQSIVDDFLAGRARQPAAAAPASASEIWNAAWQAEGLGGTMTGGPGLKAEARDALASAIEREAGKPIEDYARDQGVRFDDTAGGFDRQTQLLGDLAGTLPEDAQKRIEPLLDVRRNAAQKAEQIATDAAGVIGRSPGLSSAAIRFAAGAARQALDPANVAAMAITAPLGGGMNVPLWQFVAKQGVSAGVAQALQEPFIQSQNEDLGFDHGFGEAAGDVLQAAAGGAVLSGGLALLLRGGAAALRLSRRTRPGVPGEISATEPRPAGGAPSETPSPIAGHPDAPLAPADLTAVARLAERDQVSEAMAPEQTAAGQATHAARIEDAHAALELGEPIARPAGERVAEAPAETEPLALSDRPLPESAKVEPKPEPAPSPPSPAKPGGETQKPAPLGSPELAADAARVLAENGGDIHVRLDENIEPGSARGALAALNEDHAAAQALAECVAMEAAE